MLKFVPLFAVIAAFFVSPVAAEELTWRKDVQQMLEQRCLDCHGSDTPEYKDGRLAGDRRREVGSWMDTFIS
nr:hypothetical protein [Desulfosediminicola ganghwensis]